MITVIIGGHGGQSVSHHGGFRNLTGKGFSRRTVKGIGRSYALAVIMDCYCLS